jgi:hypothetical protein
VQRTFGGGAARWRQYVVLVSALTIFVGLGARAVAADDDREAGARKLYALGRFAEAAEIYAQLYSETLHPTYLRNVGRCYQGMGDGPRAISVFHEYLRKAKDASPAQRAEVEGLIREIEGAGRRPAPVTARPPPGQAVGTVTATTSPPDSEATAPIYKRWWFWTAIGVVAAGVGIAAAGGAFTHYKDAPCTASRCGP